MRTASFFLFSLSAPVQSDGAVPSVFLILYPEVERILHIRDYRPDFENSKLLEAFLVP